MRLFCSHSQRSGGRSFASDSSFYQHKCLLFIPNFFGVRSCPTPPNFSLFQRPQNGQTAAMAASTATATQDVTTVYRARNILGPLTTAFTPPQDCDFAAILSDSLTLAYRAQTCVGERLEDVSTCWPQVTAAAPLNSPPFNGWGFYSPGISCPAGYTSACFATQGSRTGWDMQFPMDVGETAVGCCPTYVLVLSFRVCGVVY